MDHVKIQNRISYCAVRRDIAGLNDLKNDITVEKERLDRWFNKYLHCLLYTSPSPRDGTSSRMPSSA